MGICRLLFLLQVVYNNIVQLVEEGRWALSYGTMRGKQNPKRAEKRRKLLACGVGGSGALVEASAPQPCCGGTGAIPLRHGILGGIHCPAAGAGNLERRLLSCTAHCLDLGPCSGPDKEYIEERRSGFDGALHPHGKRRKEHSCPGAGGKAGRHGPRGQGGPAVFRLRRTQIFPASGPCGGVCAAGGGAGGVRLYGTYRAGIQLCSGGGSERQRGGLCADRAGVRLRQRRGGPAYQLRGHGSGRLDGGALLPDCGGRRRDGRKPDGGSHSGKLQR